MAELVSVVIRTLNEEKHLEELLTAIKNQVSSCFDIETVIVDSGSTDKTIDIATKIDIRITYITIKHPRLKRCRTIFYQLDSALMGVINDLLV